MEKGTARMAFRRDCMGNAGIAVAAPLTPQSKSQSPTHTNHVIVMATQANAPAPQTIF